MKKTMFMFPGQGVQYKGMVQDFYDERKEAREVFEKASKITGLDLAKLCFEDEEKINITEYTQIALITAEIAILRVMEAEGFTADVYAGLSLGEYAAIVATGVMTEEEVFEVVRKRGVYMQEAMPVGGGMTAVIGLDDEVVERICNESRGIVSIANYNCPGQVVITGEKVAVDNVAEKLYEAGALRLIPLNVSGPFHSELLTKTGSKLHKVLCTMTFKDPQKDYITNVTGDFVETSEFARYCLEKQIYSPVKWKQCINRAIETGVDTFIEIGPGKSLTKLLKKIDKSVIRKNVATLQDIKDLKEA